MAFGIIKAAKKVTKKVDGFSKDFSEIKPKVMESIVKLNLLADNVNSVVTKVNENVDVLGTVVDRVKDTADSILEFEKKIQNTIEPPVMDTLNTITAVSVGVKTFVEAWKNKRGSSDDHDPDTEKKLIDIKDSIDDVNKELDEVNSRLTDSQK